MKNNTGMNYFVQNVVYGTCVCPVPYNYYNVLVGTNIGDILEILISSINI
jgi:hypothetical protein